MSALLAEALSELRLRPGDSYRTTVNGYTVELRVLTAPTAPAPAESPSRDEPSRFADQVMLEPWVTLPDPPPVGTVIARWAPRPLPDHPVIPPPEELP